MAMTAPRRSEAGVALLQVLILLMMVTAMAAGAATMARVEVLVASFHQNEREAASAAQAMLAAAVKDLDDTPDWNAILAGTRRASFADGPDTSPRPIPGGGTVVVCCAARSLTARLQSDTGLSWQPFGWQSLRALVNVPDAPPYYLVAWVADDAGDSDGNASADTNDRLLVHVESAAPGGRRREIDVLVERAAVEVTSGIRPRGLRILSWRERH